MHENEITVLSQSIHSILSELHSLFFKSFYKKTAVLFSNETLFETHHSQIFRFSPNFRSSCKDSLKVWLRMLTFHSIFSVLFIEAPQLMLFFHFKVINAD